MGPDPKYGGMIGDAMIRVIYDGNLGNNLFQYAFGRILAEKYGLQLDAKPIAGFPRTGDNVSGIRLAGSDEIVLRGQRPKLPYDVDRPMLLTGYFQRSEYYVSHVNQIKEWFTMDYVLKEEPPDERDVVVGIRRGRDYVPRHALPISYFSEAICQCSPRRVFITTNSPNDPFVKFIAKRFSGKIRPPGALDNLAFISNFSRIVISNSTFLWWGAFLSNANLVIFPRPSNGFWSKNDPLSTGIALEMPFKGYVYLDAKPYKSEFFGELFQYIL